jgi:hypothetical protein
MSYSLNRFLRPLKATDKTIRIFDDRNFPIHTINPFSVLRIFVSNSNLSVALSGNRVIVLDFINHEECKSGLEKLQSYVDQLRQTAPVVVDKEQEKYIESVIQGSPGVRSINGSTASSQVFITNGDDNLEIGIETNGGTHSLSVNWTGILPMDRGGLNNTVFNTDEILISESDSVVSSGYKFNDSGVGFNDIWTAGRVIQQISSNKVVFNIGDGQNDSFSLTHNLGTRSVIVQIFHIESGESVETEIVRIDENSVEVVFSKPPNNEEYCVVIA